MSWALTRTRLASLHRAFEDVAHAELLADRLGVEVLVFKGEGSVAGDDETVLERDSSVVRFSVTPSAK